MKFNSKPFSLLFLMITNLSIANVITVNTESDVVADDGFCSLREAVEASRENSASGNLLGECIAGDLSTQDTINFQLAYPAVIDLLSPLSINSSKGLNIIGPGYEKLHIFATQTQALTLLTGDFILSGFQLSGGWGNSSGHGGALYISAGNVTLRGMKFSNSRASLGGAIYVAMQENKVVTISSCIFQDNSSYTLAGTGYGGGLFALMEVNSQLNIKNSTFQDNSASGNSYHLVTVIVDNAVTQRLEEVYDGFGGAIFIHGENVSNAVAGTVNITRSTFSGNHADWTGAAISAGGNTMGAFDGNLNISHTTIHNNTVGNRSGDIVNLERGSGLRVTTPYNGVSFTGVGSTSLFNSIVTNTKVFPQNTDTNDVSLFMDSNQLIEKSFNIIGNTENPYFTIASPNSDHSYVGNEIAGIVDPDLQAISDVHGGFAAVHMPQGIPSIVIDKGSCPGETRDQRDYNNLTSGLRIKDVASNSNGAGDACDIGSVELAADFTNNFAPKLLEDYYHLELNTSLTTTDATGATTYTINSDNGLLANDIDLDDDSLTLTNTGVQVLGNGSLELFTDGTFSFTGHDLEDELSFTYHVTDGTDSRSQTAIIDLTPLPAPNAIDDHYTIPFNTVLTTTDELGTITAGTNDDGALANDKAGATGIIYTVGTTFGGPYFGIIKVAGIGGTFEDDLDGLFTYTPPVGVSGTAIIEYKNYVFGGVGDRYATITIEVEQESIAAVDDAYSLRYDQMLNEAAATGLLANDINSPILTTAGTFDAQPLGGDVVLQSDGSFTYAPNGIQTGIDSFEYSVDDGGVISTAAVEINVTSPIAINDFYVTDEGETLIAYDTTGTVNGSNDDGVLVNDNLTGTVTIAANAILLESDTLNQKTVSIFSDGGVRYTPYLGEHGVGTAVYTVEDDNGFHQATVEITVNYINDDPYFYDKGNINIAATPSLFVVRSWAYGISPGHAETGQVLNFVLTPTNTTGGLSFINIPQINQLGDLTFKTQPGSTGTIDIDVTLNDDEGGVSDIHSFTIVIDASNNPPIANPLIYDAIEDEILHVTGAFLVTIISNDTDVDGNLLQVVNTGFQPVNGIGGDLYLYADGRFYYRSPVDTFGVATFDYTVSDGALTDSTTITINVAEKNDKPQLQDDPQGIFLEDEVLPSIDIVSEMFGNDSVGSNEATQTLSLAATTQETGGSVSIVQSDLQFTLEQDFNGVAFFQYEALDDGTTDGILDPKSGKAFVGYSITAVNDVPTFNKGADYNAVPSVSNIVVNLPSWITQVSAGAANESDQTITFGATTTVQSGDLTFIALPTIDNNTLAMSFTVTANTSGIAEVEIVATDSGDTSNGGVNTSAIQTMQITIAPLGELVFANGFED